MTLAAFLLLISTVCGEAGVMSFEAQLAVANAIINRVESPNYPDTINEVIEQGFYGRGEMQHSCIIASRTANGDGKYFFALSGEDVRKLNFPVGDQIFIQGIFQLHLYEEGVLEW